MHFIICLSHVSIYGPLAVTICNHVSPTTRALPEAHSLEVFVCVSVRVCVATFSGMTPLLEQATVTGNGQRKTTAPTSTLLQFELRLRLQLPVFIIWPCHLYAPLGLEAVASNSLLAACSLLPSSLVLVLNLLPFCNFFSAIFFCSLSASTIAFVLVL